MAEEESQHMECYRQDHRDLQQRLEASEVDRGRLVLQMRDLTTAYRQVRDAQNERIAQLETTTTEDHEYIKRLEGVIAELRETGGVPVDQVWARWRMIFARIDSPILNHRKETTGA